MSTVTTQHNAMPVSGNFQNVPMQVVNTNQSADIGRKYANTYYGLGVTQIILGIIAIALGAILLGFASSTPHGWHDSFSLVATGIWSGVFFCVSGILGVISGKRPQYCPIVAAMVMTIFSVMTASSLVGMELTGALTVGDYHEDYEYYYYDPSYDEYPYSILAIVLHSILALIGFAEFIIAIVHSAYCCASTCSTRQPQMMYAQQAPYYGQIQTSLPGQQITYVYPGQPNTIIQANQQPASMYYPTFQSTNQQQNRVQPQQNGITPQQSPPPVYKRDDKAPLLVTA